MKPASALRLRTFGTWGDWRHWELFVWRFQASRWCPGAPCDRPGTAGGRHAVRISYRKARAL